MTHENKIILDLCGGSGAWSKPYRDAGCDVRLITLPGHDVLLTEFGRTTSSASDIWFFGDGRSMVIDARDVYGILAAPPCTEFSVAKGSRPRDLAGGMAVVEACLRIIWHCRLHGKPAFWAMENPVGLLRQFIGRPSWSFEHWEFGDPGIKPTDVWGYFNPPVKTVREKPEDLTVRYTRRSNGREWAKPACPPEYAHLKLDRAALRAITPPGFAAAFYRANR